MVEDLVEHDLQAVGVQRPDHGAELGDARAARPASTAYEPSGVVQCHGS